ncbi:hypothetical protein TNCT_421421 [Trichonephila clavata]|uniref:Uncharacterized protein n=1 Tax=Trichonephila clavata TaxID=2740835 RepID=A0A8X6KV00_TRICU|nr:hypothetical protein TNCT_421421 [Trichonephila clavata]
MTASPRHKNLCEVSIQRIQMQTFLETLDLQESGHRQKTGQHCWFPSECARLTESQPGYYCVGQLNGPRTGPITCSAT